MEKVGLLAIFDVKQFTKGLDTYLKGVGSANDAAEKAEENSFSWSRALEVFVGNALVKVGELAFEAAGAMVDFGKVSIGVAADFQDQLADLSLAASDSVFSMEELGDIAIAVGNDSRVLGASASGAAEAMTTLFKAGVKEAAILSNVNEFMEDGERLTGALTSSFDLAAASSLSVGQAAEFGANLLAVFGGEMETGAQQAEFLANGFDFISRAAAAGTSDVDTLQEGLSYVGPSAAAARISLEDTVNALNLLEAAGIQGSRAGTTLEGVIKSLKNPTDKAAASLKDMGINVFDVGTGEMLPFIDIMGQLEDATKDMTDEQKNQALGAIFQTQAMRGVNTLLLEGVDGWNNMLDATAQAATLEEQAAVKSQTYSQQVEALNGVIETLQIEIGTALLPILTELIRFFIGLAEQYGPQLTAMFENVASVITNLVKYILAFVEDGDALNDWLTHLPEPMQDVIIKFVNFKKGIEDFWDKAKPVVEDLREWLGVNIPKAIDILQRFWKNVLLPALNAIWDFIQKYVVPILQDLWLWIQENLPKAIENLTTYWNEVLLPALEVIWDFVTNVLVTGFQFLWEVISTVVIPIVKGLADIFTVVLLPVLQAINNFLRDHILPILRDVASSIVDRLGGGLESIGNLWNDRIKPAFEGMVQMIANDLGPALDNFSENVLPKIQSAFDGIGKAISGAYDWFKDLLDEIKDFSIPDWLQKWLDNFGGGSGGGKHGGGGFVPLRVGNFPGATAESPLVQAFGSQSPSSVNNFNNQREINLTIQSTNSQQSATDIYFDILAALQAVGV